ncbi:MAG TPA: HD domain-containing phosphohydrolase [Terracidiphilus sp.]|nr:HD domain-containing phosphohydrolase [Terracidiphilus sp.]
MHSYLECDEPECLFHLSWRFAQDGMIAIDLKAGTILDVNPAAEALTGYSGGELIGSPLTMLAPQDERERVVRELGEVAEGPKRYSGFHAQRKDGSCIPITISSSGALNINGRHVSIAEFRDISEQEYHRHRLFAQNWALTAFSKAALALSRTGTEKDLLQSVCEAITLQPAYVLAFVSIAEPGPEKPVRFAAVSGTAGSYLEDLYISWADGSPDAEGPSGVCIRTGQVYIVDDLDKSPGISRWQERAKAFGVRSVAAFPLSVEGGWKGALVVFSTGPYAFYAEPVQVFERLGEVMIHGVEGLRRKELLDAEQRKLKQAQCQLTDALTATVAALGTATEQRDPYTAGHEVRVADISVAIGRELGWDEDKLMGIRLAALAHDIGKIGIPTEILTKPTRLKPAEYEIVKAHAEIGYNILKDIPFPWPVAAMVLQHHEKLDGSGYPLGIKGDEIMPESQVLAVADIVEAMGTDRPYRRAHGLSLALEEIQRMAGSQLDQEVVKVCVDLFNEGRLVVPGLK